ncbi:hypothetical protein [Mixta mediterraneensis]|uniref:hypothetical protein n=1 Tax=Mixta mediterraneensis TaxID=2758443 RepID=UPI0018772F5B|nr:hypothetical protein [Mixta mediterraneensis]MBE5251915.1 hypothetical protein [Mixta mediterraneensis]
MQSGIILAAFKSPALNVNDNTGNEKLSLDQRMKLAEKEQHEKWNRTDIAILPHLLSSQDAPQLQLTLHSGRINTACSEQPKNNCLATPASGSEKNIAASHRQAQSLPSQQRQMAKDAIAKSAVTGQRLAPAGSRENIDRISLSGVGKSTVSREIKVGEGHPMSCGKQTLTPAGTGNYADISGKKKSAETALYETARPSAVISREATPGEGHPADIGKQTLTPAGTGNYADISGKKKSAETALYETARTSAAISREATPGEGHPADIGKQTLTPAGTGNYADISGKKKSAETALYETARTSAAISREATPGEGHPASVGKQTLIPAGNGNYADISGKKKSAETALYETARTSAVISREATPGEGHPAGIGKQTLTPAGTGNYADMSDKKRVVEADLHETTRTKAKEKQEEKAVYHAMRPAAPEWHSTDSAEETLSEMQKPSETVKAIRDAYLQIRSTAVQSSANKHQSTEILWRFNIKNSNADHSARVVITHGNYGNNAVYAITPSNRQVQRMLEQHKSQKEVVITPADKRLCQERSRDDYFDETEDR